MKRIKLTNQTKSKEWKEKSNNYIKELQRFFDIVDNIEDIELKNGITNQMLRCDKALTETAEKMFCRYYKLGYKEAKNGYFSQNGTN